MEMSLDDPADGLSELLELISLSDNGDLFALPLL